MATKKLILPAIAAMMLCAFAASAAPAAELDPKVLGDRWYWAMFNGVYNVGSMHVVIEPAEAEGGPAYLVKTDMTMDIGILKGRQSGAELLRPDFSVVSIDSTDSLESPPGAPANSMALKCESESAAKLKCSISKNGGDPKVKEVEAPGGAALVDEETKVLGTAWTEGAPLDLYAVDSSRGTMKHKTIAWQGLASMAYASKTVDGIALILTTEGEPPEEYAYTIGTDGDILAVRNYLDESVWIEYIKGSPNEPLPNSFISVMGMDMKELEPQEVVARLLVSVAKKDAAGAKNCLDPRSVADAAGVPADSEQITKLIDDAAANMIDATAKDPMFAIFGSSETAADMYELMIVKSSAWEIDGDNAGVDTGGMAGNQHYVLHKTPAGWKIDVMELTKMFKQE